MRHMQPCDLKRAVMVMVMFIVEVGVGFCQSPWLHPNEHSRAPHYLDWIDQLEADTGWERASLLTTLPSGRLVRMSAHAIDSGENAWVHINGDMRWVVRMNDPLKNESVSLVEGYNGGALDFVWQDHLYSLGGYGLWRRHFDLIRFHGGKEAWQFVATQGDAPEVRGDSDATVCLHADGKALLFVDPIAAPGYDGAFNYVYYVLDLQERNWTCKGILDARLGQIRNVINFAGGALMLNATGEMIWVDFEHETAHLLPNRSKMLKDFLSWHGEDGRMTFVGDSTVWHMWNGERLELAIPWQALGDAPGIPLYDGAGLVKDPLGSITAEEEAAVKDNETLNVLGVLPWIVTVLMACWLWLERQKRSNRREPGNRVEKGGAESAAAKMQYSALTQMILDHTGKHFETEELDELLGIAHLASPDTLRSQRARMIQRVNTEFRVTRGHDLIVRKRAFNDRRRSIYLVGEVDEQGLAGEGPGQGRDA